MSDLCVHYESPGDIVWNVNVVTTGTIAHAKVVQLARADHWGSLVKVGTGDKLGPFFHFNNVDL